jgi:hypothetical protein
MTPSKELSALCFSLTCAVDHPTEKIHSQDYQCNLQRVFPFAGNWNYGQYRQQNEEQGDGECGGRSHA